MAKKDSDNTQDSNAIGVALQRFVRRLVEARERLRWTQADLARQAGMQPTAISHFETGGRRPSLANLLRLSKALGVSIDWLLGLSDEVKTVEIVVNGVRYVPSPNDQSADTAGVVPRHATDELPAVVCRAFVRRV